MSQTDHPLLNPKKSGQRRILALDGGGIRGLITLGILETIENDLRTSLLAGNDFRLAHYFDFIGGTSTGEILAAGLSIGLSVSDLIKFYLRAGPMMFEKEFLLKRLWNKFKSDPLENELKQILGAETELGSKKLQTLLLLVLRNATTDSPWPITNNPLAMYNEPARINCNLRLPLWQLIRASTGAPTYFPPEVVDIGGRPFVFVDGGVTPYNLPAFLMYRIATADAYALKWQAGEKRTMIVSVGTGLIQRDGPSASNPQRSLPEIAASIAGDMMDGMTYDQDINCRTVGRCVFGAQLDKEVKTLISDAPLLDDLSRAFLYARYNPELNREGLDRLELSNIDPAKVSGLDSVQAAEQLLAIGRAYGRKSVDMHNQFGCFVT